MVSKKLDVAFARPCVSSFNCNKQKKNKRSARSPLIGDTQPFLVNKAKVSSSSQALATEAPLSRDALNELQAELAPMQEEREMAKMLVHRQVAQERFEARRTSHPPPTHDEKII
ncbi:hypothetical protein F0562_007279 [Nyssa sinensis]|uniref:Uncharacterized protein n=1 Tax=Nyssa sinensis TaxID=561372 RepID=A0A5J5A605_9ASTE|nr:hypothetical protein F0562_007279 [Nyssa sinensis]